MGNAATMNAQGVQNLNQVAAFRPERSLLDHLDMVNRRKKPFLLVAALVLTVALSLVFGLPPIYRSTATIMIEQQEIPDELVKSTITTYAELRVQEISKRILRRPRLMPIIEKFNLYADYRDRMPEEAIVKKMKESISFTMSRAQIKKGRGIDKKLPNIEFTTSFDYPKDPQLAQSVTMEIVELFMSENTQDRKRSTEGAFTFLASELQKLEAEADGIELKMANFKRENSGMLPEQASVTLRVSDRLDRELDEITRQLFDLRQQNVILRSDLNKVSKYVESPNLTNDLGERVMSSQGRVQVLQSTYVTLLSKYSPEHPRLKKIENEIASLGGDLNFSTEVETVYTELSRKEDELMDLRSVYEPDHPEVERLENEVRSMKSRIGLMASNTDLMRAPTFSKEANPAYLSLTTQLKVNDVSIQSLEQKKREYQSRQNTLEKDLMMSPMVEMEFNRLDREYQTVLKRVLDIRQKLNQAEMSDKLESSQNAERFTLIEPPEVPASPVSPNRKQILLLGLLVAPGIGFFVCYLLESFDRSVYNNRVMAQITGVEPLTVVPFMSTDFDEKVFVKKALIKGMSLLGLGVVVTAVVAYVHFNLLPMTEIWGLFVNKLELLMF